MCSEFSVSKPLPRHASIFTAELCAIFLALYCVNLSPFTSFTIYSDSKSALQELTNLWTRHPLVKEIQDWLHRLHAFHKKITFCWIPSHVGIKGNDDADSAAKKASKTPPTVPFPLPHRDYYPHLRKYFIDLWQKDWDTNTSHLHTVKPNLQNWPTSSRRNRREEVILARLRIGHTRLTDAYRFILKSKAPKCEACNSVLTVLHILVVCPKFVAERRLYFPLLDSLPSAEQSKKLSLILSESDVFSAQAVFGFLNATGVYFDI